ncbi:MAG: alpha/beta hydrolase [Lachnospiraceae bacterium]|nr:alpha/beta hydrolase [Lachnospiraceae bacterium]
MEIRTVKTDSFTMDYFCFGHGEGTFVILPGLSVQSVMGFADAVATAYRKFQDDYTVYVFDRRRELPAAYCVYQMARDTAEAMGVLGLSKANLFGASQGGMIAMEIAANHPELVRKLVLGSTTAAVEEDQYRKIEKWIQLARAGEKTDLYLAFGEAIYPRRIFEQLRGFLEKDAESVTEEDLQRFIILAESLKCFNAANDLARISCPVLVIGSEDDRLLGADASRRLAESLRGSAEVALHMYDGYGHAAYDTAPDYKDRILRFLASGAAL